MSNLMCGLLGLVGVVLCGVVVAGVSFIVGLPIFRWIATDWPDDGESRFVAGICGLAGIMLLLAVYSVAPELWASVVKFGCYLRAH